MSRLQEIYNNKDISYYIHSRPELLKFIPEKIDTVLDVGCATGNFGAMLKQHFGCKVWGIEPNENAATKAKDVLDNVINNYFDAYIDIPKNQKFDCIFFNDVLEHLPEPESALRLAADFLTTNGVIVASIPNIRYYPCLLSILRYKDFKYVDTGVMDRTHLRFFTEKSMTRLFNESGYQIKVIEGINKNKFKYLSILNFLLFNKLNDMHFPQFAIVATKTS